MKPIWFFIIFAPGMAGNHIANIISTDVKFTNRVPENFYSNLSQANTHPPDDKIFEAVNRNQVICCHLSEFIWNKHVYDNADADIKFLVVEFPQPTRTQLLTDRITKLYPYYTNTFLIEELSTMYSVDTVQKLLGFADVTALPADLVFDTDSSLLIKYLETQFDLKFDPNKVQQMHLSWVKMIKNQ